MSANSFFVKASSIKEDIIRIRRQLHACPGAGFDNAETLRIIETELLSLGITPEKYGKGGICATIGKGGKTVLLRADNDALPIKEETGLPFASDNGCFHGCGHDMHTAMLLGAAKLLKENEDTLCGCVKLMFQGAEEILEGAKDMIDAGILENPAVDYAVMMHVMTNVGYDSGTVVVCPPGVIAPAADFFEIKVTGKGAHGSSPFLGVDPIYAASQIVISLCEMSARELDTKSCAFLTFGRINSGDADNIIPDKAVLSGNMRSMSEETREFMKKRLVEISSGVANTFRANAEVTFTRGCPSFLCDEKLCHITEKYMKELLCEKAVCFSEANNGDFRFNGSEDFAFVSRKVPSVLLALAAGKTQDGYKYNLHNPKVTFDEEALPYGCAAYAYLAEKLLCGEQTNKQ